MDGYTVVMVFRSHYFALKTEKALKEHYIAGVLAPLPPVLDGSCGICIWIQEEDIQQIISLLEAYHVSGTVFYKRLEKDAYQRLYFT